MFSYYGAKGALADEYPAPSYPLIIEPFAGSARYACKYLDHEVWINDKHDVIYKVWCYLRDATLSDIQALPDMKQGEKIENFKSLCEAERLLLSIACSTGAGFALTCSKWGEDNVRTQKQRLLQIAGRIKHWRITNLDVYEMENLEGTWYIDPPYEVGGEKYTVSDMDFDKLRGWCEERRGEIIVCENMSQTWFPKDAAIPLQVLTGVAHTNIEVMWHRKDKPLDRAIDAYDEVNGVHAICAMVPDQTGEEYNRLVSQIRKNGLRRPISLDENGLILDGRHRLRACFETETQARFEVVVGADPKEFVSDAIAHRSLSVGQRAFIANDMRKWYDEQAEQRALAGKKIDPMENFPEGNAPGTARDAVGEAVGVSGRYVDVARDIRENAPELEEAVRAGEMSLNAAQTKLNEQRAATAPPVETKIDPAGDDANRVSAFYALSTTTSKECDRFIRVASLLAGHEFVEVLPYMEGRIEESIEKMEERIATLSLALEELREKFKIKNREKQKWIDG